MKRYAIKHKPTGKFLHEDVGGPFLVDEVEGFISFGDKSQVDEILDDIKNYGTHVYTENGDFPIEEFEVAQL